MHRWLEPRANFARRKKCMKNIFIASLVFLMPLLSVSQTITSNTEKGTAYIEHTVEKSQGIQAIANRYKANYSEVLKLNAFTASSVVKEGQKIKVPIAQIIRPNCEGADCIKVLYTVKQSEGLYRIGVNYGNIKMAQLKALNNLSSESVHIGQQILVGYLPLSPSIVKTEVLDVPVVKEKITVPEVAKVEVPVAQPVAVKMVSKETAPVVDKPAVAQQAIVAPAAEKVVEKEKVQANPTTVVIPSKGFFAPQFAKGTSEVYGLAAAFKSESGWADNKFYVLMNEATPGSVVMVALSNNTSTYVYAKVLGPVSQVKENENVKFRINDAGAAALGVGQQDNFKVTVVY